MSDKIVRVKVTHTETSYSDYVYITEKEARRAVKFFGAITPQPGDHFRRKGSSSVYVALSGSATVAWRSYWSCPQRTFAAVEISTGCVITLDPALDFTFIEPCIKWGEK